MTVILAAGLDSRVFRLPWPPHIRPYEVDQPAVLRLKNGSSPQVAHKALRLRALEVGDVEVGQVIGRIEAEDSSVEG